MHKVGRLLIRPKLSSVIDQLVSKVCDTNRKLGLFSGSLCQQAFMILATVGGYFGGMGRR